MSLGPEHLDKHSTVVTHENELMTKSFPPAISLHRRESSSPMSIISIISHGDEGASPMTPSDQRFNIPPPHSPRLLQSISSPLTSNKRPRLPIVKTSPVQPSADLYDELDEDPEDPPRKKKWKAPTGHRRGLSVTEMVPLDAPTRPRRRPYNDPHTVPATHGAVHAADRAAEATSPMSASSTVSADSPFTSPMPHLPRVSVSVARSVGSDDLSGDDLDMEEAKGLDSADLAAEKRRQNTIAARRSRQRKLQYVRDLELRVQSLASERDALAARIEKLEERNEIFRELLTGNAKPPSANVRIKGLDDAADVK